VVERKITMKEMLRALEERRVREVFGSGTACQVCPVHGILYEGKVRWAAIGAGGKVGGCPVLKAPFPQKFHIPTMENGPELIHRFRKELKAIQVRHWGGVGVLPTEVHVPCTVLGTIVTLPLAT
jgi:branched-chain amino acid aminotransferase